VGLTDVLFGRKRLKAALADAAWRVSEPRSLTRVRSL
jgi:hypothetical protein